MLVNCAQICFHLKCGRIILLLLVLGLLVQPAFSQFYNGHQMRFGKNRVQFDEFEWYYYRYPQFDTYFYAGGSDMAEMASAIATEMIPQLETFFDHKLEKRMILVMFQNLSDFRQSNIGLNTDADEYNIGGTLKESRKHLCSTSAKVPRASCGGNFKHYPQRNNLRFKHKEQDCQQYPHRNARMVH